MDIHETGHDRTARAVEHAAVLRQINAERSDLFAAQQHIRPARLKRAVVNSPVFNQHNTIPYKKRLPHFDENAVFFAKCDSPSVCSRLIRLAPIDHVLGGLAAAHAHVAELFLLEGDAARTDARLLLDRILARFLAAPHGFDETVAVFGE